MPAVSASCFPPAPTVPKRTSDHARLGRGCTPSSAAPRNPGPCSGRVPLGHRSGLPATVVLRSITGVGWQAGRVCVRSTAPARSCRRLRRPDCVWDRPPHRESIRCRCSSLCSVPPGYTSPSHPVAAKLPDCLGSHAAASPSSAGCRRSWCRITCAAR